MPPPTLPDLKSAIAQSFTTDGEFTIGEKPAEKIETKPEEIKDEVVKPTEEKVDTKPVSLSDSVVSDEVEVKKPEVSDDKLDNETPSAFIKRLKAEKSELANQLKQLQGKKPELDSGELEALRKERDELNQVVETSIFERSKKYQEAFAQPIAKETQSTKDLISKFTETKGVYERALALDGRERMDFLKEHIEDAAPAVFEKMSRIEDKIKDRDAALANHAEISKALAEEQGKNEGAEVLKAFQSKQADIAAKLSVYRGEDAPKFIEQAQNLLTGKSPADDVIAAAYFAAVLPHYLSKLKEATAELAVYKARDAEREGDTARVAGRGGEASGNADGILVDGKLPPLKEALKRGWK